MALFVPAMAVMNRLSYGRKFILIGALLAIPGASLLHLQVSGAQQLIEFGRAERAGVAYLEPLCEVLRAVQRHRIQGAQGTSAQEEAARQAVERAMREMDGVDRRVGPALGARAEWAAIRTLWSERAPDAAIGRRLLALMLPRVANSSNLILDPDLETYWLIDAYVGKLPELAQAIAIAGALGHRGPGDSDAPERAGELQASGQEALRLVTSLEEVSMESAFGAASGRARDPDLRERLLPSLQAVTRAAVGLSALVREAAGGDARAGERIAPDALVALESVWALQQRLGPELDRLLEGRLQQYRRQRSMGVFAAGAAALVTAYLFLAFYLSVREQVRMLAPSARSSKAGADELGQIAVAYSHEKGERSRLEEQLRQADRLATIGMLAAGTAHELNEPLGSILGFAQLAAKTPALPEPAGRDLAKISKAALHAREIIKKLLLFARQTPPQKATLELNRIVEEGIELLAPQCEKGAIQVERSLSPDLPPTVADAGQVRQIVLNLVVNAVQATPRGGRIKVTTSADETHVQLQVEDFGAGMSEEVLEQIFLPFYTTKEIGQGTGLGLSVVHGIVAAHGGTVEVDSAPGKGARFCVRLPLVPTAAADAAGGW
jgi:signal transduction histidine kinase